MSTVIFQVRELPYSEVCMHLRVAGLRLQVEPLASGMAQIWKARRKFSFPITWGEAGINRCATVNCARMGKHVVEHGPVDERTREVACIECAESYVRRPALNAFIVDPTDRGAASYPTVVGPTSPVITEAMFLAATGRKPVNDDIERVNCPEAGNENGHSGCGWHKRLNKPMYSVPWSQR